MQLFNASDEVLLTGLVAAFAGLLAVYFVSYKVCVGFISGRNTEFLPPCARGYGIRPYVCAAPAGEQCSPLQEAL